MDSSTLPQTSTSYLPFWCWNQKNNNNNQFSPPWCSPWSNFYEPWGSDGFDFSDWGMNCVHPWNTEPSDDLFGLWNPHNPFSNPCSPSDRSKKIKSLRAAGVEDILEKWVTNKANFLALFTGTPGSILELLSDGVINKLYTDGILTFDFNKRTPTKQENFESILKGVAKQGNSSKSVYEKLLDLMLGLRENDKRFDSSDKIYNFAKSGIRYIKNLDNFKTSVKSLISTSYYPTSRSYYQSSDSYGYRQSYQPYTRNYAGHGEQRSRNYYS